MLCAHSVCDIIKNIKGGEKLKETKKEFNKNKYDNEYRKTHYDRLNFLMPRGTKERITAAAAKNNLSSSEYVRIAIENQLSKDNI